MNFFTHAEVMKALEAGTQEAEKRGVRVGISVVDEGANLVGSIVMTDAAEPWLADDARGKAMATALWRGTGSTIGIYNPPTRNWNFDNNFLDPRKLPPGTPAVRTLIRGQWTVLPPQSTEVQ